MCQELYSLYRVKRAGFISGIKVYTYAYEHGPKGKMVLSVYHQLLQGIIIQDMVIAPLTSGPFAGDVLVQMRIPRETLIN